MPTIDNTQLIFTLQQFDTAEHLFFETRYIRGIWNSFCVEIWNESNDVYCHRSVREFESFFAAAARRWFIKQWFHNSTH